MKKLAHHITSVVNISYHIIWCPPELKRRMNTMWTRSYYCETIGSISEQAIQKYIENQKNA
ncbi:MAG: transposase [Bacteroidales bacterium]|nr:transposase [Bacteroidales bacterium]